MTSILRACISFYPILKVTNTLCIILSFSVLKIYTILYDNKDAHRFFTLFVRNFGSNQNSLSLLPFG